MVRAINWDELKKAALDVRRNAYAPYSGFTVGAALFADGKIFTGCNVENMSYPVGLCAERSALAAAVAAGCRDIEALVIAAPRAITACGMCRQALVEFGDRLQIMMVGEDADQREANLSPLRPDPYETEVLKGLRI